MINIIKMMIGILTFHFANNYGAVLQCFALQQYLLEQSFDVKVINFQPPKYNIKERNNNFFIFTIKQIFLGVIKFANLPTYRNERNFKSQFKNFRSRYLHLTKPYLVSNVNSIGYEFEAIIVGSDQVWNPSQHFHGVYFLAPLLNFQGLRIAYSPCCAKNLIESKHFNLLANALNRFHRISARNYETSNFIKSLIQKDVQYVVDPVLLYDFKQLINKRNNKNDPYILTYILGSEIDGGHAETIKHIKKCNDKATVISIISPKNKKSHYNWADKLLVSLSIEEWINLFYNAEYIYTDSYHAVLFALKFNINFLAYYKDKMRTSRFLDLIDRYELGTHIINSLQEGINKNSFNSTINFNKVNASINRDIHISKHFIKESLEELLILK